MIIFYLIEIETKPSKLELYNAGALHASCLKIVETGAKETFFFPHSNGGAKDKFPKSIGTGVAELPGPFPGGPRSG